MTGSPQYPARRLCDLLQGLVQVASEDDRTIESLSQDSRTVRPGGLFLAVQGDSADGRAFIGEAVQRGASAVAYEPRGCRALIGLSVPAFPISGLRSHLGQIANRFFGEPSKRLFIFGVTGTNGKTSFVHLCAQTLELLGYKCGLIGTLGSGRLDSLHPMALTTPDSVSLHAELRKLADANSEYVCLEVSSHGLTQSRVDGVAVDAAVFTNISHDHLDYHGDTAGYIAAKSRLFGFPGLRYAVINQDDPHASTLLKSTSAAETWTFGVSAGDVHTMAVRTRPDGLDLDLNTPAGEMLVGCNLLGRVNVANVLAVVTALLAAGWPIDDVAKAFGAVRPVPGRMELFRGSVHQPWVVVDYAHTPDALEQALLSVREHASGRLWCVFGCGGDRDRAKRPMMGRVAERLADEVVLTDDNPRHESSAGIIEDIRRGMQRAPRVIHERPNAIADTLRRAAGEDLVVVAGKGHETTQQIGEHKRPLSDREVVSDILSLAA